MFRIEQGILQRYTDSRTCNVIQLPNNYLLTNVRVPHSLWSQYKPLKKSIVLVVRTDDYNSFLLAVLRDPQGFLENGQGIRGSETDETAFLQAGEVFMEASGTDDPDSGFSGTGGTFYLSNDGTVALKSGKNKEYLILGGEDTDDDGEVLLVGDNGFFESNVNHLTNVRSSYRFDVNNNIELGNFATTVPGTGSILEVPIGHMKIDTTGKIVVENTTAGVSKASITWQATGNLELKSPTQITADASLINLNSGTFGVARLNDLVTSNLTTDTIFWQMITALYALITTYSTYSGGSPTPLSAIGGPALAFLAAAPQPTQQVGKITSASTTVKAGG